MAAVEICEEDLGNAEGKVVIITGGSSGIGRAAAELFHHHGAKVVIGDLRPNQDLITQLGANCTYQTCDVTIWSDLLDLFDAALKEYGRVDVVLANAGVPEIEDCFDDKFDTNTGRLQEPKYSVLEVNLKGVLATVKVAKYYFEQKKIQGAIILTSSTGGICGDAYIPAYTATKHGLMGLMRAVSGRGDTPFTASGIRVNCVCPFMTETGFMTKEISAQIAETGTPVNTANAVAKAMMVLAMNEKYSGNTLFVANNKYTELEGPLRTLRPQWLGEENSRYLEPRFDYMSTI